MCEVLDFTVVACDGKHATVDFDVWSDTKQKSVPVRAHYKRGDDYLTVDRGVVVDAELHVMTSDECLRDIKEAVEEQRETNRSQN